MSASGSLELPALGADTGFGVAVWGSWGLAKMPVYLPALAGTREHDGAAALGGVQSQLVKGKNLAPSLEDAAVARLLTRSAHTFSLGTIGAGPHHYSCLVLAARKLHLADPSRRGREAAGWSDS
jgi:hypothetical protein